jgi:hypothetical protein
MATIGLKNLFYAPITEDEKGYETYVVREVKGARYPLLLAGKPQDEAAYWIGWAQPGGVQVV